jgi:hypothetical protein
MLKKAHGTVERRSRGDAGSHRGQQRHSTFPDDRYRKRIRTSESQESKYESDRAHWAALKV